MLSLDECFTASSHPASDSLKLLFSCSLHGKALFGFLKFIFLVLTASTPSWTLSNDNQ